MLKINDLMVHIKKMMQFLGLGEAESTIYAFLALSESPMTIGEIAEKTYYSIPRIYSSLSYLMKEGLVEKRRDNGTTKYFSNINFIDFFEKRRQEIMERFIEPMTKIEDGDEKIKKIVEYSRQVYNYFEKLNEIKKNLF
ncbi:MAG: ArsR family transcriptional regulator [Euryarchaeota archaeon]|nr:ArsR family transcriptional regulator [Euryarchaeota archaeon]